ncbi:MAG: RraA family protein [Clostridiales bacterium]|nr:RraA family protein [Clostridiales bacterium]MDY4007718.1 RraA family protein [Candidatus Limiplasma sp.]
MLHFDYRDEILALTPLWKGERFPDGRPKVPDAHLKALRGMTMEEVWRYVYSNGYQFQFQGGMRLLHGNRKLIGRAVTCNFCPSRPDLETVAKAIGDAEGRIGVYNQWVVDSLLEHDVLVADMFDKIYKGTFLGGNLTTAIAKKTKDGGAVVWGGIRDIEQMQSIHEVQVYYRGIDPTPIRDFVMTGFNTPTTIGQAICLPGDVVFGNDGGVLFIPSHLVAGAVLGASKAHVKDIFGFEMLSNGIFTTAQIDLAVWPVEMLDRMMRFISQDDRCIPYRDLDWTEEYERARKESNSTESAL